MSRSGIVKNGLTVKLLIGCFTFVAMQPKMYAQDACVALLKHGIYNTVRTLNRGASSSTVSNQICTNYSLYKSGKLNANASGSFGLFSAGASFSKEQVESIGQAMCSSGYSDANAASQIDNFSSILSDTGARAFNECIRDANVGLIVNTTFDESTARTVRIDAHYSRIGAGPELSDQKIFFEVGNPWSQSVTLATLCIPLPDKRTLAFFKLDGQQQLPVELKPGQSVQFWLNSDQVESETIAAGIPKHGKFRVMARDALGTEYLSESISFKPGK